MDDKLQNISLLLSSSDDINLIIAKNLSMRLDECIKYTEGIKQRFIYLSQEEADLKGMMLDGHLETNPDLLKFHKQTVSIEFVIIV